MPTVLATVPPAQERLLRVDLSYRAQSDPTAYVVLNVPLDPSYGPANVAYLTRHPHETVTGLPASALFGGVADISFTAVRDLLCGELNVRIDEAHANGSPLYDPALPLVGEQDAYGFLQPLATHGYEVYRNLFERLTGDLRHPDEQAPWDQSEARALIREYLASASPRVVFKVPQEDAADPVNGRPRPPSADHWIEPFPWRLLFDRPPDELSDAPAMMAACWGLKYQLETAFKWTQRQAEERVFANQAPRVVAATCPSADPTDRHRAPEHPFSRPGVTVEHHDQRDPFRAALHSVDADVVSFFGHAEIRWVNVQTGSWLEFRPRGSGPPAWARLTAAHLDTDGTPKYQRRPVLVFLNGCGTAPPTGLGPTTVFGQFANKNGSLDHRVRCVATMHEAPIQFGLELGAEFWGRVLPNAPGAGGEPVGAALLAARQHMVSAYNNPLGLLYALFGDGLLRYSPG